MDAPRVTPARCGHAHHPHVRDRDPQSRVSPGCRRCVRSVLRQAWDSAQSSYSLKGRPSFDRRSCRDTPWEGPPGREHGATVRGRASVSPTAEGTSAGLGARGGDAKRTLNSQSTILRVLCSRCGWGAATAPGCPVLTWGDPSLAWGRPVLTPGEPLAGHRAVQNALSPTCSAAALPGSRAPSGSHSSAPKLAGSWPACRASSERGGGLPSMGPGPGVPAAASPLRPALRAPFCGSSGSGRSGDLGWALRLEGPLVPSGRAFLGSGGWNPDAAADRQGALACGPSAAVRASLGPRPTGLPPLFPGASAVGGASASASRSPGGLLGPRLLGAGRPLQELSLTSGREERPSLSWPGTGPHVTADPCAPGRGLRPCTPSPAPRRPVQHDPSS